MKINNSSITLLVLSTSDYKYHQRLDNNIAYFVCVCFSSYVGKYGEVFVLHSATISFSSTKKRSLSAFLGNVAALADEDGMT